MPKSMELGLTEICGAGATAVPDRASAGTAVVESLVTEMLPLKVPVAEGANTTLPTAVADGASVSGSTKPFTLYAALLGVRALT